MAEEGDLLINGKVYDPNTMTFREQREMRRVIREEIFDGEEIDEMALTQAETIPAIAVVLVRRDRPEFTVDEALDLVPTQVLLTKEKAAELNGPPTPRASRKRSTSAAAGRKPSST